MKTLLTFFSLLSLLLPTAVEATELRLLSYNIHSGIGTDKVFDLERIADVIKSANPHVVSLQEVGKKTRRSRGVDIPKELARLTGMKLLFGPAISIDGGEYGNAILTSLEIESDETLLIPEKIPVEQRSVLAANLEFNGTTIQILATHFCHRENTNRAAAAEFLVANQAPADTTSFVIGDLNALPESEPLEILTKAGYQNPSKFPVHTFPATGPNRQIDYVLYRPAKSTQLAPTKVQVIDEAIASDHRPLLVVFK